MKRYAEFDEVKRFISNWLKEAIPHDDIELPQLNALTLPDIITAEFPDARERIVKEIRKETKSCKYADEVEAPKIADAILKIFEKGGE